MDTTIVDAGVEEVIDHDLKMMQRFREVWEARNGGTPMSPGMLQQMEKQFEKRKRNQRKNLELKRMYETEIIQHRQAYRFTPLEIHEIKCGLENHLEEMVVFLVGYKWTKSAAGYYHLWQLPFKVGYKGIFDLNKPHWNVPAQDLIWFWMDCRRAGRSDDEWNFHSACVEIRQWLRMVEAGKFKKPDPQVIESHRQQREHDLRRSLADLFKEGKLESITLQRKFGDGRVKTKRVSILALRRALQQADSQTWENISPDEFTNFIIPWINDEDGHWVKFKVQTRKRGKKQQQLFIILTLDGYETPEEEYMRRIEEERQEEWIRSIVATVKDIHRKREAAARSAAYEAEEKRKAEEAFATRAAVTPEERDERDRPKWEKAMKESPYTFAALLKEDPSLSRFIPEDYDYPLQILANCMK